MWEEGGMGGKRKRKDRKMWEEGGGKRKRKDRKMWEEGGGGKRKRKDRKITANSNTHEDSVKHVPTAKHKRIP
ncbi:hypothetical protein ACOMHN_015449 [Nucella lapillus]